MNYKRLCKKYFPHVEIVWDATDSPYYLTPAKRAKLSQKELVEIDAKMQDEFSEERGNHGLSYGGSDVPIILGKGFIPASQLAAQKRNRNLKTKIDESTQAMFDTGHRAEDSIRETFERVSGFRTMPWPIMMRNPEYPHFLMNIDGLFLKDKSICLYEGKWSQNWRIINEHWKKARDIRNEGLEPSITTAPEKYLFQVWAYLAGLDLDLAVLCGGWGYADNEIGYIYIPRLPKDKETELMEICENFIEVVESGEIVSDLDFKNKAKLHDVYKHLHAQIPDSGKPVVFPVAEMPSARRYLELQEQIKELENDLDDRIAEIKEQFEADAGLAALKEERDSIQTFFEGQMAGDCTGTISDGSQKATLHWDVREGRKTFNKKLCKEKYPEVFDEVYTKGNPTKVFSITIEDAENEGGKK